jgi:hypothetical protein
MTIPFGPEYGFGGLRGTLASPPNLRPIGNGGPGDVVMGKALVLPLPEDSPIPDAHEFNVQGSIASAVAQNNILVPNTTVNIPALNMGVLTGVSIYIDNMLLATNVTYTVRYNGAPIPGYTGLTMFPRVAPFVGNTFASKYRFNGEGVLDVIFSNIDGGAYVVGAALSGWFWPCASDVRWKQRGE